MAVPVACILETPRESGTVLTPLKNQPALIVDMLAGAATSARGGRLVGESGAGLAWRRPSGKERRQPGLGDRGEQMLPGGSMCGCKIFGHNML